MVKVGDIVRGYYAGIWRITKVTPPCRENPNAIIEGVRIFTSNYKKSAKATKSWAECYCKVLMRDAIVAERDKALQALAEGYDRLLEILQ